MLSQYFGPDRSCTLMLTVYINNFAGTSNHNNQCNFVFSCAVPQKASGISFKPLASPHESLHDVLLAAEVTRSVQFHFSTETTKGNTILHEIEQLADRKENDERCRASSTCVEGCRPYLLTLNLFIFSVFTVAFIRRERREKRRGRFWLDC